MFSRDFRRQKRAKVKIYLIFEGCRASVGALTLGWWWCPLGAGGAGCRGFRCPAVCVPSLCSCLLSALSLRLWCYACKYAFICDSKGVFSAFWCVRVGLCCLLALRGLCGFYVREWLGGLEACGVFCLSFSSFILFCPLLCSFRPALVLLSWLALLLGFFPLLVLLSCLSFLCGLLLFPFPLRTICKKGRKGFAPCVLSSFVVCLLYSCIVIKEFCSSCFGFFQFARFVIPTNTASI